MTTLTYPYLGDAVQVGDPLGCDPTGCDPTGWPYRVEDIQHTWPEVPWPHEPQPATLVTVEPWPIPAPDADEETKGDYQIAMAHARDRWAGIIR